MTEMFVPRQGWGPYRQRAALSLSFDNFGEAAEIESGNWGDRPVGSHYTAAFVPQLVELLGDLRATYFVEASNAAIYPDALRRWRDAGHEIGVHGWRHERWEGCTPTRRRELLARSLEAMRSIGLDPIGFRPPGGRIPRECFGDFQDAGLSYFSDLGQPGVSREGELIRISFDWMGVDSFVIEDLMAPVRRSEGRPEAAPGLGAWRNELSRALDETIAAGSHRTIVFHPMFLAKSDDKLAVVSQLIEMARARDVWIAPIAAVARFAAGATGAPADRPWDHQRPLEGLAERRVS